MVETNVIQVNYSPDSYIWSWGLYLKEKFVERYLVTKEMNQEESGEEATVENNKLIIWNIKVNWIRWASHEVRSEDTRLLKTVFF